jgi:hypothetical protein
MPTPLSFLEQLEAERAEIDDYAGPPEPEFGPARRSRSGTGR